VEIGSTVGRYRIDEWLASGAMGEVYRGYDPVIDRKVAIKVIRRELLGGSSSEQWLERFKREARAAGQRFHPNIVTVLDYGEEDGRPFLAMEFVDGPSLASLLKTSGPLPPDRAVSIMMQVLSGLGFAHESGIIHRDIKPSNILVTANGAAKIADFGIARTDASDLTVVGDVLGTPAYVAPEQLRGDPVDNRSDLFAAGVMFFEALTGIKPFRAKTLAESMTLMQQRGPEDVCALNPLVPGELKGVIDRALAFDPARRFSSAFELSRAIATASGRQPDATGGVPVTSPPPEAVSAAPAHVPAQGGWDPELLRRFERELATFIGPLAALAVKQSARRSSDLGALYEALVRYIDDERDRHLFLKASRGLAMRAPERTGPLSSLNLTGGPPPGVTLPPIAILAEIETSLTQIIGPIAKLVIKRHLRSFASLPQFYQALAADIPNEQERKAFLDSMKTG
jgi:eukaryotic-like serine/threonine-protein kinase